MCAAFARSMELNQIYHGFFRQGLKLAALIMCQGLEFGQKGTVDFDKGSHTNGLQPWYVS